ncbi:ribosomal protein L18 [Candidatus Nitrososphaera evergladensis SR1]|uniref:Large ribosomal subunit protein uL18 n=1 Tax=Candidatus Nitrososphaera evergladensis SR1 TaxID=1459636 RepID=A0A075MUN5_9ARCH|nr:50S ribosomal protein L18 [Candidatus Nitrososphaera evergladensis]AIF84838.1 ribosomal protein L18 [Candidatus Nitrososphaera evergladensis SR1]
MTYVRTLKRIRLDKTNYRKRAAVIVGRHSFATVKVTDQNVAAQILKPTPTGDLVIASAHSHELVTKHGWKGSTNSLPACYLTGLLLGKKALEKGTNKAVLYIGKDHFTTRVATCAKGIADSGVNIPISEESLPDAERISGQHIADYASSLKANEEEYKSRFSALLKNGLKPEDYPAHFEEVRFKISGKAAEEAPKPKKEKKEQAAPAKEGKSSKDNKKASPKKQEAKEEKPKKSEKAGKKKE